ncbi:hypothetical protein D3C72_1947140 [compost metagenome]
MLARGGAEGVGRSQQHALACIGQVLGQLADGCGLARAIDACDHDDRGALLANDQRLFQRRQQIGQCVGQQALDGCRVGGLAVLDALFQIVQQVLGGLDAGIGHQQGLFQLLIQLLVDLGAGKDGGNARARLAQAAFEPVHPAATVAHRFGCYSDRSYWRLLDGR